CEGWQQRAYDRSRLDDGCRQTGIQTQLFHEIDCPGALDRIDELSRSRIGEFANRIPGEPIIEEVRYRYPLLRNRQDGWRVALGSEELIERVDRHELDTCCPIDLVLRYLSKHLLHHSFGAAIAIVIRILKQFTALAQQSIV